ncbi:hypothetical protein [Mitsuokella sp. WILCCON 0060]|uniref:hypothetical protein n=1 Tax=unclassified Mitsuokella TaxID=2637239 RepID=UPI003EFE121B
MMKLKMYIAAGAFAAAGLMTTGMTATVNAAEQIPNPIVTYNTVQDAAKAAGITPLYLPKISGYHVDYISVIGNDTVDLSYVRDGETQTRLRVRTTKTSMTHLSGINGVNWKQQNIDHTQVAVAELPTVMSTDPKGYAAEWQRDGYHFSITAENISSAEFQNLLEDGLVDLSEHYFD